MSNLKCPACQSPMETRSDPDVQIDVCPQCGGRFLDKGELNAIATGMAGDIEYCSIDTDAHPDKFPVRQCPKCSDQPMQKISLLAFSDIIFDFCTECGGFFLDSGEADQMNRELAKLSGAPAGQEIRETVNGRQVRLNRIRDVRLYASFAAMGAGSAKPVESFQLMVYLKSALGLSLKIFGESWKAKLAKVFGLFKEQDVQTGDEAFDSSFVVQGNHEEVVKRLLSRETRKALLDFVARKPRIFSEPGSLTIWDDCVEYLEGPYAVSEKAGVEQAASPIIRELVKLAALFEAD